jgi:hypothetical protein
MVLFIQNPVIKLKSFGSDFFPPTEFLNTVSYPGSRLSRTASYTEKSATKTAERANRRGGRGASGAMLDHLVGLVKVRVVRGVNLAIRDLRSSDPYVVVRMGKQVRSSTSPPLHPSLLYSGLTAWVVWFPRFNFPVQDLRHCPSLEDRIIPISLTFGGKMWGEKSHILEAINRTSLFRQYMRDSTLFDFCVPVVVVGVLSSSSVARLSMHYFTCAAELRLFFMPRRS